MIEIRIIGSFIAIDNREKSRDCPSSSNNPVVSDNRRSDNQDLTVCATSKPSDQPALTRSLIRASASRLSIL